MKVMVKLFAQHKGAIGRDEIEIKLENTEKTTVDGLLKMLMAEYPALEKLAKVTMVTVNYKLVNGWELVKDGDQIALFPPMGGG